MFGVFCSVQGVQCVLYNQQDVDSLKKKPAAQAADATLPHATSPIGKINPFSKMAITFEPIMGL